MAGTTLTMKLLINSSPPRRRVVFAEARKDTVDFLISLLAMPAGTTVKLLGKESMVGCIGNLYASAEKLEDPYVQPGAAKDAVLSPTVVSAAATPNSSLFRLPEPAKKSLFSCTNYYSCRNYVTDVSGTPCPYCGWGRMTTVPTYAPPGPEAGAAKGFVVGGIATYTVTDDLMITPMSNVSSIALLNTFAVTDIGKLQEKTVQIGYNEGVEILKAALQSKTVLTDVFIGKKSPSLTRSLSRGGSRGYESLTWRA